MMKPNLPPADVVHAIAIKIGAAVRQIQPPKRSKRPSTVAVYRALKSIRGILKTKYGGPVFSRYSGCPDDGEQKYSRGRQFKVLEYLWDFSFSRFAIPQAIEDHRAIPITNGKYQLLFVAESELGSNDEICRDLLKLLEACSIIRCLVFKDPKRLTGRETLHKRMIRVLHNHAHCPTTPDGWLFVGLMWAHGSLSCQIYRLNQACNGFVPADPEPVLKSDKLV